MLLARRLSFSGYGSSLSRPPEDFFQRENPTHDVKITRHSRLVAAALWMARALPNAEFALLYGIVLGKTFGPMLTVRSVIWAKNYGRRHLGNISGLTATISVASSALGPMPLDIARDLMGCYDLALMIAAVIPLVLSVVSLSVAPLTKHRKAGQGARLAGRSRRGHTSRTPTCSSL